MEILRQDEHVPTGYAILPTSRQTAFARASKKTDTHQQKRRRRDLSPGGRNASFGYSHHRTF
jgi:hypothetical protein